MEQIARECKIGLVAYTITHHTRQSAVGLPFIKAVSYTHLDVYKRQLPSDICDVDGDAFMNCTKLYMLVMRGSPKDESDVYKRQPLS